MMEGMLIVTKQDRKPSHTRAMRSRLIAAAVSVATVLGLAVTGTAIAANVGTVAPEAAQSATTQASQARSAASHRATALSRGRHLP